MTDRHPPLDAAQLGAYFALMEVAGLLRHAVEQQLREAGDLSYVQFQLLARLGLDSPTGSERMTDLADGVVYSRSGLTYQAGLLEKAGLVTRTPSEDDERGVTVTITEAGRALLAEVLPGHTEVIERQLFQPLTRGDIKALADLLSPVRDHMRSLPPRSAAPRRRRSSPCPIPRAPRRASRPAPALGWPSRSPSPKAVPDEIIRLSRTVLGRSAAPQAAAMMASVSSPISRRTRKDALENRDRVLDAATELVRSDGEKVPMGKIAERAGVGIGTVYRHFATREDLLGALVHRSFGIALANAGAAAAHPGSALEGVRLFFLATLRDRERFVLPLHGGPAIFTPATRQRQADVRTALRALLERGQAAGELRADLTPEDLIVATSLLSRPLPGTGDWDVLARRQIDLMIDGLVPRRPPPTA